MYSIYLTSLLVSLVTVSCRNSGESDLSEVVGRSEGETVKRRIDSAFTVQRSGPKTAGDVFQSEGLASAEFKIYERYTVYHEEERDYLDYEYKDTKERATGTERAWQGYFEFDKPQRDKPELLAKAVLGIGDSRAEAIVNFTHDGAPLSRRPRSWEEFKSAMKEIDQLFEKKDKYKSLRGVYKDVIMDNGSQNIAKLEYQIEGQELVPVRRTQLVQWSEVREKFIDSYDWKVPVKLKVSGVMLLPTESESFHVYVSESSDGDARVSADSNYADYQIKKRRQGSEILFELTGSRKAAKPQNKVLASIRGGGDSISVSFNDVVASQLGQYAGNVVVDFSVRRDSNRWFVEKNLGDHQIRLNGASGEKKIAVPKLKSGENFVIQWTIRRENSEAYDPQRSSSAEVATLQVN